MVGREGVRCRREGGPGGLKKGDLDAGPMWEWGVVGRWDVGESQLRSKWLLARVEMAVGGRFLIVDDLGRQGLLVGAGGV